MAYRFKFTREKGFCGIRKARVSVGLLSLTLRRLDQSVMVTPQPRSEKQLEIFRNVYTIHP